MRDLRRHVGTGLKRLLADEPGRVVLAVSGGMDSTCLLQIVGALRERPSDLHVATFDHGTGIHSASAVDQVRDRAASFGLPFHTARADRPLRSEGELRMARWSFLRTVAGAHGTVVTAHTASDHAETVVMRILRHSGARGLAALRSRAQGIVRPLLDVTRVELLAWATEQGLVWTDDPSNTSPQFLRNRVRLDLLPALERHAAGTLREIFELSRRAAELCVLMESLANQMVEPHADGEDIVRVRLAWFDGVGMVERGLFWQSLLGPRGVQLDRRGTRRLAELAGDVRSGSTLQLSGGYVAVVQRGVVRVRPAPASLGEGAAASLVVSRTRPVRLGSWLFRITDQVEPSEASGGYSDDALIVGSGTVVSVRPWRGGDRVRLADGRQRRVKRFLYEAGVPAPLRRGWPVVEADGEIICVPGVCRANATPDRSGRPVRRVVCERLRS